MMKMMIMSKKLSHLYNKVSLRLTINIILKYAYKQTLIPNRAMIFAKW